MISTSLDAFRHQISSDTIVQNNLVLATFVSSVGILSCWTAPSSNFISSCRDRPPSSSLISAAEIVAANDGCYYYHLERLTSSDAMLASFLSSVSIMSDCAVVEFEPSHPCTTKTVSTPTLASSKSRTHAMTQYRRRRNSESLHHYRQTHGPELCRNCMVIIPRLDAIEADEVEVRVIGRKSHSAGEVLA
jgi:hypothetical protein